MEWNEQPTNTPQQFDPCLEAPKKELIILIKRRNKIIS